MINHKQKAGFRSLSKTSKSYFALLTLMITVLSLSLLVGTAKAESGKIVQVTPSATSSTAEIRANLEPIVNLKDTLWYPVDSLVSNSIVISTATLSSKGAKSITSRHKMVSFDPKKKKSWKTLWPIKSFK